MLLTLSCVFVTVADKTMQQVLSKSADLGFCGPEQTIYIYNQNKEDYPVLFAQGTQTDGAFIVGRTDDTNFTWEKLRGKDIVGGRPGGIPEMALELALKNHGLTPGKDVNVITNIAFAATTGAFKGGTGQYAALFEPNGSMLKQDKSGYIVASVGESAGVIPETCYFATKSYIDNNPEVIQKFTNALYKGQLYVKNTSDAEIAKVIKPYFAGTDISIIQSVITNYKKINAFSTNPLLTQDIMNKFMDIIQGYKADLIPSRPPFNKIVNTSFATKAMGK